jgi:type I restriction enzyme S subunit
MKKGWEWKTLGQICDFQRGLTYSKKDEVAFSSNIVLRATNIDLRTNTLDFSELKYIAEAVNVPPDKKVREGGLLVCMASGSKTHLGKVALVDQPYGYAFGGFMGQLLCSDAVLPRFLYYSLIGSEYQSFISGLSDGANINNLRFDVLATFGIPIAPLPEQRRIVGILDEAFAGLATAEANAARNLQNAREIFDSHLHAVFSQRGATRPPVPLRQCVEDIATGPFGSLLHKSDYEVGGIPLVNPINIEGEAIVPDDRKAVGRETAERLSRYVLKENDVVIGRRGEIGRCAVITSVEAGWICGTGCFVIRPTADTNPHYLAHLLRSKPYREQLEAVSERATMPSISNEDLGNLDIRIPPLPQQKMVLRSLNLVSAETQRVATLQQRKIVALGELKKSLLHQAFSGGL